MQNVQYHQKKFRLITKCSQTHFKKFTYSETGGLNGPWPSPMEPNVKCIRSNKWKLIYNKTPNTWELYNLQKDPNETKNLYEYQEKIVKQFKQRLLLTEKEFS